VTSLVAPQRDVRWTSPWSSSREDAGRAVQRRGTSCRTSPCARDGRLTLHQVDVLAGVGEDERRVDAGDAPPTISTSPHTGTCRVSSGVWSRTRRTAGPHQVLRLLGGRPPCPCAPTRPAPGCFTIWKKVGLKPPSKVAFGTSSRGGAASRTPPRCDFRPWSRMSCLDQLLPGSEHMNLYSAETTTRGGSRRTPRDRSRPPCRRCWCRSGRRRRRSARRSGRSVCRLMHAFRS